MTNQFKVLAKIDKDIKEANQAVSKLVIKRNSILDSMKSVNSKFQWDNSYHDIRRRIWSGLSDKRIIAIQRASRDACDKIWIIQSSDELTDVLKAFLESLDNM